MEKVSTAPNTRPLIPPKPLPAIYSPMPAPSTADTDLIHQIGHGHTGQGGQRHAFQKAKDQQGGEKLLAKAVNIISSDDIPRDHTITDLRPTTSDKLPKTSMLAASAMVDNDKVRLAAAGDTCGRSTRNSGSSGCTQ